MMSAVNPADCGGYYLHEAHSWREGFMYLTKRVCRGTVLEPELPEDFEPPNAGLKLGKTVNQIRADLGLPEYVGHKHFYQLKEKFSFGPKRETDILWGCNCGQYFVTDRNLWWDKGVWYDVK